jgi:hypothetical protein
MQTSEDLNRKLMSEDDGWRSFHVVLGINRVIDRLVHSLETSINV